LIFVDMGNFTRFFFFLLNWFLFLNHLHIARFFINSLSCILCNNLCSSIKCMTLRLRLDFSCLKCWQLILLCWIWFLINGFSSYFNRRFIVDLFFLLIRFWIEVRVNWQANYNVRKRSQEFNVFINGWCLMYIETIFF
jgi:hypothetical protein